MGISANDILNLKPILQRFDEIDSRLTAVEAMQGRLAQMALAPVQDTRAIDQQLAELKRHIPAMLDAMFAQHVTELRDRIEAETKQVVEGALESFESALEKKFGARIATIEKALIDQSSIITTLSERAIESDANLQRLVSAVEKLCERTEFGGQPRPASNGFEGQLAEATTRQSEPLRQAGADPGFRPRILKEDEANAQRHRRKLTLL